MTNVQSLQEKVIKGSFIALVLALLGSIGAYLVRILYSHSLTVESYGLFYATFGLFSLVTAYNDLGFGYSIVYLLPKYIKSKNYSKAWNVFVYGQAISLTMSITIAIIMAFLAPFLAKYYFKTAGSENLVYIFCIYQVSLTILTGLIQLFSGMQKEKYYSSITTSRWFLTFVFSLLFFLFNLPNVIFYAIAWASGHILTAIVFLVLLYYRHPLLTKNKIVWDVKILKQMFSLAFPVLLESLVYSIVMITDTFFLTLFKGVRVVGIYNIIYPLASISIVLFIPINSLLLPLVSHLMEGEKDKMKFLMKKILEIGPFVGLYFALFIIMFPSAIAGLIFGQKWLGLIETPLIILSLGAIAMLMSGILGTIISGIGKIKEKLKVTTITTIITATLNAILIWQYGILGVVITTGSVAIVLCILFTRIIKTSISFQIPYWFYLKLLIFASSAYVIVKFTKVSPQNWLELISLGITYTIIFIIFGYMLKIYDKKLILMVLSRKSIKNI